MSYSYQPKIARDGLVFATDAKNPKSTDYKEDIVTDGLIFYTNSSNPKCTNSNTSAIDLISNNTGTLNGGMTVEGTDWTFDGVDEYINFGNTFGNSIGDNYTGDMTISVWLNTNITNGNDGIFYTGPFNSSQGTISMIIAFDLLFFRVKDAIGYYDIVTDFTDINNWNQLTIVYKSNDISNSNIYINNTLPTQTKNFTTYGGEASGWPSSLDFSGFDTIIGGYFNSSYLFDGEISNVKIYNRVLSQEEITQNYNAGRLATLPSITNQT